MNYYTHQSTSQLVTLIVEISQCLKSKRHFKFKDLIGIFISYKTYTNILTPQTAGVVQFCFLTIFSIYNRLYGMYKQFRSGSSLIHVLSIRIYVLPVRFIRLFLTKYKCRSRSVGTEVPDDLDLQWCTHNKTVIMEKMVNINISNMVW